jgi:hypothetical protein
MTDPVENEKTRILNEVERIRNESDDEVGRVGAEEDRVTAEWGRVDAARARAKASVARNKGQKLFVIAMMLFAIIVAIGGFYLIDNTQKIHKLTHSNSDLIKQLKTQQAAGRDARIASIADTNEKVRQLACIIISQTNPKDPKLSAAEIKLVDQFREEYQCPPFSKTRNPFAPLPAATSSAQHGASSQTPASGTPGASGSTGSAKSGSSRARPTPTPGPTTPTSRTTPPSASKPSGFTTPCTISKVCVGTICLCV